MRALSLRSCFVAYVFLFLTTSAFSQKKLADPLTTFLNSRGFANLPYIKQNQAKLGVIVAAQFSGGVPIFEDAPPNTPNVASGRIEMPGETIAAIQAAGLGIKVFGLIVGLISTIPNLSNMQQPF